MWGRSGRTLVAAEFDTSNLRSGPSDVISHPNTVISPSPPVQRTHALIHRISSSLPTHHTWTQTGQIVSHRAKIDLVEIFLVIPTFSPPIFPQLQGWLSKSRPSYTIRFTQQSPQESQSPPQKRNRTHKAQRAMSATDPKMGGDADAADKSRQKSCNACVRSKRRCDKRTPRCTRCSEKNFACVYQNLPPAGGGPAEGAAAAKAATVSDAQDDPLQAMDLEDGSSDHLPPAPHPFDFNTLGGSSSSTSPTYVNGTLVMDEPTDSSATTSSLSLDPNMPNFDFNSVMDFLNVDPAQGGEMQVWETPQFPQLSKSLAPELPYMGSVCCGMERDDILVSNPTLLHRSTPPLPLISSITTHHHVLLRPTNTPSHPLS